MSRTSMTTRFLGSILCATVLAVAGSSGATEWPVVPVPGEDIPGVQRDGTLRFVRYTGDGSDVADDQGTVVGWLNRAATGRLVPNPEENPVDEATIEILRARPAPAADAEAAPAP